MIRRWWERWPAANVGIATGPESGIFVLDVDGEDGQESLKALESLGELPKTLRAHTGRTGPDGKRTGFHLYFTWPPRTNLSNSAGRLGKGLDIRAAGGYVVAPPSLHASGLLYGWDGNVSTISDPPAWLLAKASKPVSDVVPTLQTCFLYEGQRNDRLFRLASAWRRRGATQEQLERQLSVENVRRCRPPLERAEIQKIAANVARSYFPGGPDPLEEAWATRTNQLR
jgi:putative DNA primase/helicase